MHIMVNRPSFQRRSGIVEEIRKSNFSVLLQGHERTDCLCYFIAVLTKFARWEKHFHLVTKFPHLKKELFLANRLTTIVIGRTNMVV